VDPVSADLQEIVADHRKAIVLLEAEASIGVMPERQQICAESKLGAGSTFSLLFPESRAPRGERHRLGCSTPWRFSGAAPPGKTKL
jgi:hypothetical protein